MNHSWFRSSCLEPQPEKRKRPANGSAGRRAQVRLTWLHVQLLVAEIGVKARNGFGVSIVKLGRDQIARAEIALHLLAPARMRHSRVHVCPEAVFGRPKV